METMKLAITIDKAEALKAGSPVYGETTIEVTEELLAMLEPDARAYLALADRFAELPTSLKDWERIKYQAVNVPPNYRVRDIADGIVECQKAWELAQLKAKLEKEKEAQKAAEKETARKQEAGDVALAMSAMSDEELFAACYRDARWNWFEVPSWIIPGEGDPRVSARLEKIKSQCEAAFYYAEEARRNAKKAKDAADKAEFAAFVEAHCDANQRERFAANKLPTEEVLALKRDLVFPHFETYQKLLAKDLEHEESCYESKAKFHASEYDGDLGPKAWETFRTIRDEVLCGTPDAEIEIRKHEMWCAECDGERVYRYGIKVSWEWAGHELVREYALGNPRD